MTFLQPLAFFFAALAPAVIALYLRRARRREKTVASLLFWQRVLDRSPQSRFLGRLRHPFSLALALLILALLVLALARPQWGPPHGERHTVIVLDQRARMQAGGAFGRALAEAERLVATAGPDEQIALVGVAAQPRVLAAFSRDAGGLRKTLATLRPTDGGGSMDDALALARGMLEAQPGPTRLFVTTDRPPPGAGGSEIVIQTGRAVDNLALLRLSQAPIPASPQSLEILATVGNFTSASRTAEIEFLLDGKVFQVKSAALAPGEKRDIILDLPAELLPPAGGKLEARLTGGDAFPVDDTARLSLAEHRRIRVLLVSENDPTVESALKADQSLSLDILAPSQWQPSLGGGFDVVVWDAPWPAEAGIDRIGAVSAFFLRGSPFENERAIPRQALDVSGESPLLWQVDTRSLEGALARKITPPTGFRSSPALEALGEAGLVTLESAHRRLIVSALDLSDSNLPLRPAFPLLMSNAIHWLAGATAATEGRTAGEVFRLKPGEKLMPGGDQPLQRLDQNGFYQLDREKGAEVIAVNTASEAESDLRSATGGAGPRLSSLLPKFRPWQWLVLAALALLVAEWASFHHRLTE